MRDILRIALKSLIVIALGIVLGNFILKAVIPSKQLLEEDSQDTGRIWEENNPVVKEQVRIPNEEDIERLEEICDEVIQYLESKDIVIDEITELYAQVQEQKVCSKANKRYKELKAKYDEYEEQLVEIQTHISKFEEEYNAYISMLEAIPKYSKTLREKKYLEFEERLKPKCDIVLNAKQRYQEDEETITEMQLNALKIADDFFEEYYELMCQLVVGEAGNGDLQEQSRIINVAENRVEHPAFKYYTIYEVMFAPGQYECTWNGGIYKPQSEQLRENVRAYLRGEVDTGMPDDVVWQAKFPQGSRKNEPWFYNEVNGHYFCYY